MPMSVVDDLLSGPRGGPSVGAFELAVAVGALADLTTTTFILLTGRSEANVVLSRLADVSPWLAVAAFWGFGALLVGTCWLRNDWLARLAGAYTLVALGVAGVFNVVLYTTGVNLMPFDPAWYIHQGAPAFGVLVGAAWLAHEEDVPWGSVAATGGAFVTAAWLLPIAL